MVQLLEELLPELQAHIAGSLDDAAAAGRWAQACRASRLLLVPRLEQLLEVWRSAWQQAMLDKLSRPRRGAAAALSVYDMGNGDAAIRVLPHTGVAPSRRPLRQRKGKLLTVFTTVLELLVCSCAI